MPNSCHFILRMVAETYSANKKTKSLFVNVSNYREDGHIQYKPQCDRMVLIMPLLFLDVTQHRFVAGTDQSHITSQNSERLNYTVAEA